MIASAQSLYQLDSSQRCLLEHQLFRLVGRHSHFKLDHMIISIQELFDNDSDARALHQPPGSSAIIAISVVGCGGSVANLLVRDVDDSLVKALKQRAGKHGRSAQAEHRAILAAALGSTRRRSFAQVLASMPDVGTDEDFARVESKRKASRVFG